MVSRTAESDTGFEPSKLYLTSPPGDLMLIESWEALHQHMEFFCFSWKKKCPIKVELLHSSLEERQLFILPHGYQVILSLSSFIGRTQHMVSVALTRPKCCIVRHWDQQSGHHDHIDVAANPAKHECSSNFQFMSAGRECSVKIW